MEEGTAASTPEGELEEKGEKIVRKLDWDSPTDPDNPRNWSISKKWSSAAVTSLYTFVAPLASSMMAPGLPEIARAYGTTDSTVIAMSLSIFVLAFGVGPLFLAPLSEMYGRRWVLHICNIFFLVFLVACAKAPTMGTFIAFRFLSGLGGSAPLAVGGGLIADLWDEKERASAMAIYSLGPLVGPVLGPVAGGFIVQSIGFHWIYWILTILTGVSSILGVILLRETYAPLILSRRATRRGIRHLSTIEQAGHTSQWSFLLHSMYRPWIILFTSIICFSLSLYMALIYGFLYLLFVTYPTLYQVDYGWGPGVSGLAYLGPGLGFFMSTMATAFLMDRIYAKLSARNGGVGQPEFRIPVAIIGAIVVPIGLFWYGWSAQAHTHWIMPIIGGGIFSFGMMLTFFPLQVYIVDTFEYAASALAAATVFRCMFGFGFPLFGQQMFSRLGNGGGNSLLAGLAIVLGIPFPVFIWFKGAELRARSKDMETESLQ
ncbi:MFS general substrate transporter [Dacryopinax primogenitus]|uniref:MFS general substrate transporter n=1 Tax=Dacryopinax primogenitus (strain DJM 731) TaxID=1858805 RepID=M5G187_DACPD|nr:MFS general substrate transporter [Dacryopinax primogenitus]EJT97532.1 MFS general substrate transporter [Dacryopinax primogenitus]